MKVLIGGPKGAGKNFLRNDLVMRIHRLSEGRIYPFPYPANPDGEGRWYPLAFSNNPDGARANRNRGQVFTDEFAGHVATSINQSPLPLILADMGGQLSSQNRLISTQCGEAKHAILLYSTDQQRDEWLDLLGMQGDRKIIDKIRIGEGGRIPERKLDDLARKVLEVVTAENHSTLYSHYVNGIRLEADLVPAEGRVAPVLIRVYLNPEGATNPELVRTALDHTLFNTPDLWSTEREVVAINGPLTMAVAVALCLQIRQRAPNAEIQIWDPETDKDVTITPEHARPTEILPSPLSLLGGKDANELTIKLSRLECSKQDLVSHLVHHVSEWQERPDVLRINGRMPVSLAAALALRLAGRNARVDVYDPAVWRYLRVWPPKEVNYV